MGSEAVTRHGYLALREEHGFIREGYEFLDEKRLLLAQRILTEHRAYRALQTALEEAWRAAVVALSDALGEGGLHLLSVTQAPQAVVSLPPLSRRSHLGVAQLQFDLTAKTHDANVPPVAGSPLQQMCAEKFAHVTESAALLAACAGNLHRLVAEYRRTDRRARALENVVLPEVKQRLHEMEAVLEDTDLEEITRIRLAVERRVSQGSG